MTDIRLQIGIPKIFFSLKSWLQDCILKKFGNKYQQNGGPILSVQQADTWKPKPAGSVQVYFDFCTLFLGIAMQNPIGKPQCQNNPHES